MNIFADLNESFAEISPEKVLTLNPDAIVFEWYPAQETEAEQKAAVVQRLSNSEAVRSGKVIGVSAHLSEGTGVAVIEAIELVAKGLYH